MDVFVSSLLTCVVGGLFMTSLVMTLVFIGYFGIGEVKPKRVTVEDLLYDRYLKGVKWSDLYLDDGRKVKSVGLTMSGKYSVMLEDGQRFTVSKDFNLNFIRSQGLTK